MAESLPEGYEALGQPFTDEQGNTDPSGPGRRGQHRDRPARDRRGGQHHRLDLRRSRATCWTRTSCAEPAEDEAEEEEEAEDMASQMAESLPEGYQVVGEPTTDEEGNRVLEAQDEQGNTVTIRREIDDAGQRRRPSLRRARQPDGREIVPNPVEDEARRRSSP